MSKPGLVLQLEIKPARISQLGNGRWIQWKDDRVLHRHQRSKRAPHHSRCRMFRAHTLPPILQPHERQSVVLTASTETESSQRDETVCLRLLEIIILSLLEHLECSF